MEPERKEDMLAYRILAGDSYEWLEDEVNKLAKMNYVLLGPPWTMITHSGLIVIHQAMVHALSNLRPR